MTRWIQCPDCRGLGKTKKGKGKVCRRCKGRLYIAIKIRGINE